MKIITPSEAAFPREEGAEYTVALKHLFLKRFGELGYQEIQPVNVSSGIDPTVHFIGSHISVLKKFISGATMPEGGVMMVQDCVRTRNSKLLGRADFAPKWGSFFHSLGALTPYKNLGAICQQSHTFFTDTLGYSPDKVIARVSARDADLLKTVQENFLSQQIEADTMPEKYYRHSIGMPNVVGRNFNIALRDATGEACDVGNVIILERDGTPFAVELALGASTILKQTYNLSHVLDCHPVCLSRLQKPNNNGLVRQLEDTVVTVTALCREGLRPSNKNTRARILKKYIAAMQQIGQQLGMNAKDVSEMINNYQQREYGNRAFEPEEILSKPEIEVIKPSQL